MNMIQIKTKMQKYPWLIPGGIVNIEDGQYFMSSGNTQQEITSDEFYSLRDRIINAGGQVLPHPGAPVDLSQGNLSADFI